MKHPKKEKCEDYNKGYCEWYSGECFHNDEPSGFERCYRLIPRKKSEMMKWMGELCSDCNEVVCNDCNMYQSYKEGEW